MNVVVTVLGGSGMLGSMVVDYLARDSELDLRATVRSKFLADKLRKRLSNVKWQIFDAEKMNKNALSAAIKDAIWIINAIGLTKPYIHDDDPLEIERAIRVNAMLPYELANAAAGTGGQILQIATDCVYSGVKGRYTEKDLHDPTDVYGKTKSLGEAKLPNVHCLRTSIVGPEPKANVFLLEWLRGQPENTRVNGYTNHQWNGVTTLHFAKVCHGIIKSSHQLPHVHHLVPSGSVTKAKLLEIFARSYGRADIAVVPTEAEKVIDRTLSSENSTLNLQLWRAAGYMTPPTVPQMVQELAEFNCRITGI